jgi:ornithine racemase
VINSLIGAPSPRIEIDLAKIEENTRILVTRLAHQGISVTGITKATLGLPAVAKAMVAGGVARIGDSRIANLERLREAGITTPMMLIRSPTPDECERAVATASVSLVSEVNVIHTLSLAAQTLGRTHDVVLMIELGDLREGVLPDHAMEFARRVGLAPHVGLVGIGTNLACRNGVVPTADQMSKLDQLAERLRADLGIALPLLSGGNSANLAWALSAGQPPHAITDLRIGEAILLGTDPAESRPIAGLHMDAFTLVASVIESLEKPTMPWGDRTVDSFGGTPAVLDRGTIVQTLVSIGRQDVELEGLIPPAGMTVLGASSDHLVLETPQRLAPGTEIRFQLGYSGLMRAMTSPYVASQTFVPALTV